MIGLALWLWLFPGHIEEHGERQERQELALLVGIDQYAAPQTPRLNGAVNDVQRLKAILESVYGFQPDDITTLCNEQATLASFKAAWAGLVKRADNNTEVVFFFAGHGSQVDDRGREEADGLDETLVFYDSRTEMIPDLGDDQLNGLLGQMARTGASVTMLLDAGGSGGAGKGSSRWIAQDSHRRRARKASRRDGKDWDPHRMQHLVVLSAAREGAPAHELPSASGQWYGAFSNALCTELARGERLTYQQLHLQMSPHCGWQRPVLQGDFDRLVFSAKLVKRPLSWSVLEVGETFKIGGPLMPSMGPGAEFRVFAPTDYEKESGHPKAARGLLVVTQGNGFTAIARLADGEPAQPIRVGDMAIPVRVGDDRIRLNVRFSTHGAGAIPGSRVHAIRKAVEGHELKKSLIQFDGPGPAYRLTRNKQGLLELLDPSGKRLLTYDVSAADEADKVAANLMLHARMRALLALRGEGGEDFTDGHTLQVRAVRANRTPLDCAPLTWLPSKPNHLQILAPCLYWRVEVSVVDAPGSLLVGGVFVSSNGTMVGFPEDGGQVRLRKGQSHVFRSRTFRTLEPNGNIDYLFVFGTSSDQTVNWGELTQGAEVRPGSEQTQNSLARALGRYLSGTRNELEIQERELETWTMTVVEMLVK